MPEPPSVPLPGAPVLVLPQPPALESAPDGGTFVLQGVAFEGNTVISTAVLAQLLAPAVGAEVGLADLQGLANYVSAYYAAQGYPLVQTILPPQRVTDGQVLFRVVEGFLDRVRIERSSQLLDERRAAAYLADVVGAVPLAQADLERRLLLLNRLPGIAARANLAPGALPGSSTLGLMLQEDARWTGAVHADNYGGASTGEARLGAEAQWRGLTGRGDRLRVSAMTTEGSGIQTGGLDYSLPLGVSGWALEVAAESLSYTLGGPFANLDGHGRAHDGSLRLSYPLLLTPAASSEVWLEYRHRSLVDRLDAVGETNRRRLGRAELGISRAGFDRWGGWNYAMLSYSAGQLQLGEALARAGDAYGQHGFFSKANLLLNRQQHLADRWGLRIMAQGQYAWQNLDSGEKFSVGGPYSVRAYPVGELSGDHGWLLQWALQWYASEQLTLSLFSDRGWVRFNADELAGIDWRDQSLRATGLSLDWHGPHGFELQASWAWAGGYASRSDPGNTHGRFYAVVRRRF